MVLHGLRRLIPLYVWVGVKGVGIVNRWSTPNLRWAWLLLDGVDKSISRRYCIFWFAFVLPSWSDRLGLPHCSAVIFHETKWNSYAVFSLCLKFALPSLFSVFYCLSTSWPSVPVQPLNPYWLNAFWRFRTQPQVWKPKRMQRHVPRLVTMPA